MQGLGLLFIPCCRCGFVDGAVVITNNNPARSIHEPKQ